MKLFEEWLAEADIEGLRDVRILRHYTNIDSITSIVKSKKLIAHESEGDAYCWNPLDYDDAKVVSFLEARNDTVIQNILNPKNSKFNAEIGRFLPSYPVAVIEVDYDKIEPQLEKKASILKNLKIEANFFFHAWNKKYIQDNFNVKPLEDWKGWTDAVVNWDLVKVMQYLRKIKFLEFRNFDEKAEKIINAQVVISDINGGLYRSGNSTGGIYTDLKELCNASKKEGRENYILNNNLEIRIPSDIVLTKDNCRVLLIEELWDEEELGTLDIESFLKELERTRSGLNISILRKGTTLQELESYWNE